MVHVFAIVGMVAIYFAGRSNSNAKYLLAIIGGVCVSMAVNGF